MELFVLIDLGSTFTKVVAIDLEQEEVLGVSQAISTATEDVTAGMGEALQKLIVRGKPITEMEVDARLVCSSACGGLKVVSVGLIPELTLEAAKRAALGAGAKVTGAYSHEITAEDLETLEKYPCDLVLLTGGTDGGDKKSVVNNAKVLAGSRIDCPVVFAGNKGAKKEVLSILQEAGKYVEAAENVLPELDRLNVEPVRSCIRDLFIKRITRAKGLDVVSRSVGDIIMPTPTAVLTAAALLADGTKEEPGLGDLLVVDVGGSTTDVHSVAKGCPTRLNTAVKGLPEPYVKRTVEGDLGMRSNASSILDVGGKERLLKNMLSPDTLSMNDLELERSVEMRSRDIGYFPQKEDEFLVDVGLARTALEVATERHAAVLHEVYTRDGIIHLQEGKDLTEVKTVIGTGGIFAYGSDPAWILEGTLFDNGNPLILKPRRPDFYIDERYILYAVGLLSGVSPTKALRVGKRYLKRLER